MSELTGKEKMILSGSTHNKLFWSYVIKLAGVEQPKIVIDTVAAPDDDYRAGLREAGNTIHGLFGATVTLLNPFDDKGNHTDPVYAADLITGADILYPCGGDTKSLQKEWHNTGRFAYVESRLQAGDLTVVGASAGSLIWSEYGFSDYRQYRVKDGGPWDYEPLPGRGLLPGWINVHHSAVDEFGRLRQDCFEDVYRQANDGRDAIGLDNFAGVQLADGTLSALSFRSDSTLPHETDAVHHYEHGLPGSRHIVASGDTITL